MIYLRFVDLIIKTSQLLQGVSVAVNFFQAVNYDNIAKRKRSISDLVFWAWCSKSLMI